MKTLEQLVNLIASKEGFTYQPIYGTEPTEGYVVSPYQMRQLVIPRHQVTPEQLALYVARSYDVLWRKDHYIGAWVKDGQVYLDVCIIVSDPQTALDLAERHQQQAVWDLDKGESIFTKGR